MSPEQRNSEQQSNFNNAFLVLREMAVGKLEFEITKEHNWGPNYIYANVRPRIHDLLGTTNPLKTLTIAVEKGYIAETESVKQAQIALSLGITPGQFEIIQLLSRGKTNAQIEASLALEPVSIRGRISDIAQRQKLPMSHRRGKQDIIIWAAEEGITLETPFIRALKAAKAHGLTETELRVVQLIAQNKIDYDIAKNLDLHFDSIKTYKSRIRKKISINGSKNSSVDKLRFIKAARNLGLLYVEPVFDQIMSLRIKTQELGIGLDEHELQFLPLVAKGLTNAQIAARLSIMTGSVKRIKNHLKKKILDLVPNPARASIENTQDLREIVQILWYGQQPKSSTTPTHNN